MAYFSRFPLVNYFGNLQVNLTRRVDLMSSMRSNERFYIEHSIQEGDTPESLADKLYDDVELAWVILMFNNIINIYEEWPKEQNELESYILSNYDNPSEIHHWKSISSNIIVDPLTYPEWDRIPVTNYEYEIQENDKKRNIKLILPEYIGSVIDTHKSLMG